MAGLPFVKVMLTFPRHITFAHVPTNSTFFTSFYEAAVQYPSAPSFLCCWKSRDLPLLWKAGTKPLPWGLYFPHCTLQVLERQEFFPGFPRNVYCCFQAGTRGRHDTQRSAAFPRVRIPPPTPKCYEQNSLLRSVLSTLSEVQGEWSTPFGYISRGQEMPLSRSVPWKPRGGSPDKRGKESSEGLVAASHQLQPVAKGKRLVRVCWRGESGTHS